MSDLLTRSRCWGLTALPFLGLGSSAVIEYLGLPLTGIIRVVLALSFIAVLVGSGAAFLAWGYYLQSNGRYRLGRTLARGVPIVFTAWIGWSVLGVFTHAFPFSVAVIEALVLGTAIAGDVCLGVLLLKYNFEPYRKKKPAPTVNGMLIGMGILVISVFGLVLTHHWTSMSLGLFVIAIGVLGFQLVRLKHRVEHNPPLFSN